MSDWIPAASPEWEDPLTFASRFAGHNMAFLYSSLRESFSGDVSFLFVDPIEAIAGNDWAALPPLPSTGDLPLWVGYLGYGMRDEDTRGVASPITLPDFQLVRYAQLYRFDHEQKKIEHYRSSLQAIGTANAVAPSPLAGEVWDGGALPLGAHSHGPLTLTLSRKGRGNTAPADRKPATIRHLTSNLTRAAYESIVADTIDNIRDGNFYQANITRKFFGEFVEQPDSWQLFSQLCTASPAPYSAYIRHGSTAILSSSPECFLTITSDGTITTRPIKGSARRSANESQDTTIRAQLLASPKNHAENLMIVDLMRNDLSRVSEPQTVEVIEQSSLYSYRTIHHLISTIRAKKLAGVSAYDTVRACFPAGSMTGAPKIAAMHWCTQQEKLERGIYSGAIGWFGGGDTCDLSVVIRTLILDGNRFEFQVGGGIVADSTPEDEWRETITKARGILAALGLKEDDLEAL